MKSDGRFRWIWGVVLSMTVAGCAAGAGGGAGGGSPNVLTSAELEQVRELNCYEAVQRLRPNWLRTRGRVSMLTQQGIQLYVDNVQRGYVTELVSIRASSVERMRFLSAPEATARFGTDHVDGAVLVTTRRGGDGV